LLDIPAPRTTRTSKRPDPPLPCHDGRTAGPDQDDPSKKTPGVVWWPGSSRRAFQQKPISCPQAANGCTRSSTTASASSHDALRSLHITVVKRDAAWPSEIGRFSAPLIYVSRTEISCTSPQCGHLTLSVAFQAARRLCTSVSMPVGACWCGDKQSSADNEWSHRWRGGDGRDRTRPRRQRMGQHLMRRPPKYVHGFTDRHGKARLYFQRPRS
jgi:hypothetical protein